MKKIIPICLALAMVLTGCGISTPVANNGKSNKVNSESPIDISVVPESSDLLSSKINDHDYGDDIGRTVDNYYYVYNENSEIEYELHYVYIENSSFISFNATHNVYSEGLKMETIAGAYFNGESHAVHTYYTYDSEGRLATETTPYTETEYEYIGENKVRGTQPNRDDGLHPVTTTEYNDRHQVILETSEFVGTIGGVYCTEYKYDVAGKLTSKSEYTKGKESEKKTTLYKYDSTGHLIQESLEYYDNTGNLIQEGSADDVYTYITNPSESRKNLDIFLSLGEGASKVIDQVNEVTWETNIIPSHTDSQNDSGELRGIYATYVDNVNNITFVISSSDKIMRIMYGETYIDEIVGFETDGDSSLRIMARSSDGAELNYEYGYEHYKNGDRAVLWLSSRIGWDNYDMSHVVASAYRVWN